MTELLTTLEKEVGLLLDSGSSNLTQLANSTESFLEELRQFEAELVAEINDQNPHKLPQNSSISSSNSTRNGDEFHSPVKSVNGKIHSFDTLNNHFNDWYTSGIQGLKSYNGQITKFLKNIVNNSKFKIDLDDAYTFPLDLNSAPTREDMDAVTSRATVVDIAGTSKLQNRRNLLKTISVHFLKMGYGSCINEILHSLNLEHLVSQSTIDQFTDLGKMVEDIKVRHDLSKALDWVNNAKSKKSRSYTELQFRLDMLQYVLLLNGTASSNGTLPQLLSENNSENRFAAMKHALKTFPKHFDSFSDDIGPLMVLLVYKHSNEDTTDLALKEHLYKAFMKKLIHSGTKDSEKQFVAEILRSFDNIRSNQRLFDVLATKLTAEYCANMGLSSNSSLFEALLSGFVNLPNFYKYSRLQLKMNKQKPKEPVTEETDLPFQLPDKNRFLFNYHPIFICPVSKEQLMPLTNEEQPPKKKSLLYGQPNKSDKNPVVVFQNCRHLALKESVKSLLRGSEKFKCHYCYKKHRMLEVQDAYFIDL